MNHSAFSDETESSELRRKLNTWRIVCVCLAVVVLILVYTAYTGDINRLFGNGHEDGYAADNASEYEHDADEADAAFDPADPDITDPRYVLGYNNGYSDGYDDGYKLGREIEKNLSGLGRSVD